MSTAAMKFVPLVKNDVVTPQATVFTGRHNVISVSGLTGNGTLKFEVSVDGGVTYVEDFSLECNVDGLITLENAPGIIRAKLGDVSSTSGLLVLLGY